MFSKPLSLTLVYIITVFNFLILSLPFLVAIFPFIQIEENNIIFARYISFNPKIAMFFLIFIISSSMLIYLFLDFLFGFSVKMALKNCTRFDKLEGYEYLNGIFGEVKNKFGEKNVKLYISKSREINAFAVGSFGRKAIVITDGLIERYANNTDCDEEFLTGIRSILGHEMSHLINKDFLPGLIIITNQKITNFASGILSILFRITMQIIAYLRINNHITAYIITSIYNITDWILTFFNRYIIYNVYQFLKNFLSRSIEYRADRQSAKAFGGINMAFTLSLLGKSGYFTLFSTHPATQRRMKKVEVVEEKNAVIKGSILSRLFNLISIMLLPIICLYAAHLSKLDVFAKYYLYQNYPKIYQNLIQILNLSKDLIMNYLGYLL
jgi:Zn-dependent protease with chaperone function